MHKPLLSPCRAAFFAAALAAASAFSARGAVFLDQTLSISPGWNAVFVEVSPTGSLSQVFSDWPTDSVGLYDPASFLATRQRTSSSESQGMSESPIAMWHRDHPEASDALFLPANTVCIFFNTNTAASTLTVRGVPAAPRTTWHPTGPKRAYNFFGLSLQSGKQTSTGGYLAFPGGFPGISSLSGIYRIYGNDPDAPPSLTMVRSNKKNLADGGVLLVPSDGIYDWSGTLYVSPMNGLDFGTDANRRVLLVRNDTSQELTASIDLVPSVTDDGRDFLGALRLRDTEVAVTNAAWIEPTTPRLASKLLSPGEEWRLEFGLDRQIFDDEVLGTPFGAVLRITDDDGASALRVDVPIEGTASGRKADENAWPGGLWVAEIEFGEIYFEGDPDAGYTGTGGTLKARLPVHIDTEGMPRLLQRVVVAGSTSSDGEFDYTLYAGDAQVPSTSRQAMRISSAVLPTETPVVEATTHIAASGLMTFDFAVAADGATSLLRHPLHPQHDGLLWDFETPAPSGDDFANYQSSVKPETFSVTNKIVLQIELNGGEASWNPEDVKSGTCFWHLSGLRHEGEIVLRGPMRFRRIAPESELVTQ